LAVYTKLHIHQLEELLKLYDIGSLITYNGITEGIENSNFFIETTQGKFILTIFENRVNKKEIPFFFGHNVIPKSKEVSMSQANN